MTTMVPNPWDAYALVAVYGAILVGLIAGMLVGVRGVLRYAAKRLAAEGRE